jgi:copper homeostasis protein
VVHRALDFSRDPREALAACIDLGVTRVLTAGASQWKLAPDEPAVLARCAVLCEYVSLVKGRVEIMPGGGVRPENAALFVRHTPCAQLHSACRSRRDSRGRAIAPDRLNPEMVERLKVTMMEELMRMH